jgi:hypothetical protein
MFTSTFRNKTFPVEISDSVTTDGTDDDLQVPELVPAAEEISARNERVLGEV